MKIIKTNIESVSSIDKEKTINVELVNSHKNIIHTNVVEKLNARTVFEEERANCDKYRLIFTIKPLCSNVLFNPFTEIVRYDFNRTTNSVVAYIVKDDDACDETNERIRLIQNTSNKEYDWEYHPGYDMFNNHLIRSQTFKIVQNKQSKKGSVFNTLKDKMYDNKSRKVQFYKRMWDGQNFTTTAIDKHLYKYDDILPFNDGSAINKSLIEENGWFGFENGCRIKTKINGVDQNIDKVINYKNGGDFIDMYPDRTLFSFNPKQNKNLHRLEYNWHYVLTYPFACDKTHPFCKFSLEEADNITTGLKIVSVKKTKMYSGGEAILFRTYTKHGLKVGDNICLTVNVDSLTNIYKVVSTNIVVSSLGNTQGDDRDHCFICNNMTLLHDINNIIICDGVEFDEYGTKISNYIDQWMYDEKGEYLDDKISAKYDECQFIINRMYNGVPSEYYFRIFKKIPNLKFKKQSLTPEISIDVSRYENYINNNCEGIEFTFENSKLGFANSIYSDNLTQLVYTDDIDLTNIVDNLGRPLSEIYLTIIKNNKGYDKWYDSDNWDDKGKYVGKDGDGIGEIEYSHCFGPLTCGLEFGDSSSTNTEEKKKYASNGDVRLLNNVSGINDSNSTIYTSAKIGQQITKEGFIGKVITTPQGQNYIVDESEEGVECRNLYYGDFVEYNPTEAIEKVLEVCNYRFNTYLRECNPQKDSIYKHIVGWDIYADDYDLNKDKDETFQVEAFDWNMEVYQLDTYYLYPSQKPEGYYYKPHYRLLLKELGTLKQDSHYDMEIQRAQPKQFNGIYISITTKLRHGCVVGDKVFICDIANDKWYYTYVTYVVDKLTFFISHILTPYDNNEQEVPTNWLTIAENLNNKTYKIKRENTNIPRYAQRINSNQFLWREILNNGDNMATYLPEYPYTNNAFYITQDINFYLKRQDPFGQKGLFTGDIDESFPQDPKGESEDLDNYEYKDETQIQC